jgi:hypothetical protein
MKAVGFPWRPQVGDWYVSHTGHCEIIQTYEQAKQMGGNGDIFLPTWQDCRQWLLKHGWLHPEVDDDHFGQVRVHVTHESGRIERATGDTELDCLYGIILGLLFRTVR